MVLIRATGRRFVKWHRAPPVLICKNAVGFKMSTINLDRCANIKGLLLFSCEKSNYDVLVGKMVGAHVQCAFRLLSNTTFSFFCMAS